LNNRGQRYVIKKLFITYRQREQAERMAAKWGARAEAFWNQEQGGSNDEWGYGTAEYCKTAKDAEQAEACAERIHDAIARLTSGCGTWDDIKIIQMAVAARDALDAGVMMTREIQTCMTQGNQA
jgi:hypothetical protein